MKNSSARYVGTHRKQSTSATRRVAFATVATSAVAGSGFLGGNAGTIHAQAVNTDQTSHTAILAQGVDGGAATDSSQETTTESPRILEVPQGKEITELTTQLASTLRFAEERIAADLAARAPLIAKPAEGTFTSGFGPRWGSFHAGIDIANAIGTPILAAHDGVVIDSGPASGYGNWIRIQAEDGTITVYGHMATLNVSVGEQVTAGQQIAGMGSEGFSTGSHLHFEVHPNGSGAIDPLGWLAERGIAIA